MISWGWFHRQRHWQVAAETVPRARKGGLEILQRHKDIAATLQAVTDAAVIAPLLILPPEMRHSRPAPFS
jgi:hypothetical protein